MLKNMPLKRGLSNYKFFFTPFKKGSRGINIFLFLLLFATTSFAQKASLLWEISGNGLTKPSYVYGTIHLICPKDYFMTDSTKAAFARTDQLYLELDMDDPTMMRKLQQTTFFTDGKHIKDYLSAGEYDTLAVFMKGKGMSLESMGKMKPLGLMSMMYMALLNCMPQSYEMVFTQMATNKKKEVLGLESFEYQLGVFDSIPYQMQASMLAKMAKDTDKSLQEFDEMVATYKSQDIEKLLKLMDKSDFDYAGYEDVLLNNRNKNWIPIMQEAMQQKPTFFAVGAAHLGGEKGVLNLLKQKGYTVKPM